jgi:hypothetical protein
MTFKNLDSFAKKTHASITSNSLLVLFKEIIVVYSEKDTKPINRLRKVQSLNVKLGLAHNGQCSLKSEVTSGFRVVLDSILTQGIGRFRDLSWDRQQPDKRLTAEESGEINPVVGTTT